MRRAMTGQMTYVPGETPRALPDFHVFFRYAANFPWISHGLWFLTQMVRWDRLEAPTDWQQAAAQVYRPDLFREAAALLGLPAPAVAMKTEGEHTLPWMPDAASQSIAMGPDRFLDGRIFDPRAPLAYLDEFSTASPEIAGDALISNRSSPSSSTQEFS